MRFKLVSHRVRGDRFRKDSNVNFTVEAKWYSMQTPHAKYPMPEFDKVLLTKPRVFTKKLEKQKPVESWKIPKMDGPAPGSYDTPKAYNST